MVYRKILGRPVIHTQGDASNSGHLTLYQLLRRFRRKPRKMHLPPRILVPIPPRIRPTRSPSSPQKHNRPLQNPPVLFLPFFDARGRHPIVGILRAFRANIQHNGRAKELFRWNLIHRRLARREMDRRIQMRSVMLQHPKTASEVPVLLHRGVRCRLEHFLVSRPRHELIADCVTKVQHPRLPAGNVGQQILTLRIFWKNCHEGKKTSRNKSQPPGDAHLSPNLSPVKNQLSRGGSGRSYFASVLINRRNEQERFLPGAAMAAEFPASPLSPPSAKSPNTPRW